MLGKSGLGDGNVGPDPEISQQIADIDIWSKYSWSPEDES